MREVRTKCWHANLSVSCQHVSKYSLAHVSTQHCLNISVSENYVTEINIFRLFSLSSVCSKQICRKNLATQLKQSFHLFKMSDLGTWSCWDFAWMYGGKKKKRKKDKKKFSVVIKTYNFIYSANKKNKCLFETTWKIIIFIFLHNLKISIDCFYDFTVISCC